MFNLDKFIADSVTSRSVSLFAGNIEANSKKLTAEIKNFKADNQYQKYIDLYQQLIKKR